MVDLTTTPAPASTKWIIWGAMLLAPVGYAVFGFLNKPGTPFGIGLPDFTRPVDLLLTVGAAGSGILGFILPRIVGRAAVERAASAGAVTDAIREPLARTAMIIQWGQFEAVAISGFVIAMAGSPPATLVPFAAVSIALVLLHPPTEASAQRLLGD